MSAGTRRTLALDCKAAAGGSPRRHPDDLTLATAPARLEEVGDPWEAINDAPQSLAPMLAMHERDRANGLPRRSLAAGLPQAARRAGQRGAEPRAAELKRARAAPEGGRIPALDTTPART